MVDTRHLARREFQGVGAGAEGVRQSGDKEYQLSRLVARVAGAMTEMHACGTQRARAAQNSRADALGRVQRFACATSSGCGNSFCCADLFRGCVG